MINDNNEVVALVEYEDSEDGRLDGYYTGSISYDEGDDIWFSAQCRSESELIEEVEQYLLTKDIETDMVD